MLVREILSVKKEAKLSASEVIEVEEGKGDEDLRCNNLLTVCQRWLGYSDVPRQAVLSLVMSLVLSRLDYGSATLVGLPAYQIDRLQSVLNAAAQLVYSSRRYDHVTPLLRELHWLRMSQWIDYKLAVVVYRCLNGLAPSYLASDLQHVVDLDAQRRLR